MSLPTLTILVSVPSIPPGSSCQKAPRLESPALPYHSWEMASSAVILWSWSTSIRRVTSSLAAETASGKKAFSAQAGHVLGHGSKGDGGG